MFENLEVNVDNGELGMAFVARDASHDIERKFHATRNTSKMAGCFAGPESAGDQNNRPRTTDSDAPKEPLGLGIGNQKMASRL